MATRRSPRSRIGPAQSAVELCSSVSSTSITTSTNTTGNTSNNNKQRIIKESSFSSGTSDVGIPESTIGLVAVTTTTTTGAVGAVGVSEMNIFYSSKASGYDVIHSNDDGIDKKVIPASIITSRSQEVPIFEPVLSAAATSSNNNNNKKKKKRTLESYSNRKNYSNDLMQQDNIHQDSFLPRSSKEKQQQQQQHKHQGGISWIVIQITVIASIGGILFGYDLGVISGALPQLTKTFALTESQQELVVSVLYIGGLIGAGVGGPLCDTFGRKTTILLTDIIFASGAILLLLAPSFEIVILGRIILGFGIAISGIADVSYLHEISPLHIRYV
jgi:Sugar (and other) transporter